MHISKWKNYRNVKLLALGLSIFSWAAQSQAALTGTVTFSGTVSTQTCSLTLGLTQGGTSGANFTLALPTAGTNNLNNAGDLYGETAFYLGVTSCLTGVAASPTLTITTAGTIVSGYLSTGVTNLVLEFLDYGSGSAVPIGLTAAGFAKTLTVPVGVRNTDVVDNKFAVRYRANGGGVSAGTFSTPSITVTLTYA